MNIRPLKNEVLIFGASLGFSHYFIHLMPIGTILNKINQYARSAASALKFLCFGTYVNIRGTWTYILGWSCLCNFVKMPGLTLLSDSVFNAYHDKIIKIHIFSKKGSRRHFGCNDNIGAKKLETLKW